MKIKESLLVTFDQGIAAAPSGNWTQVSHVTGGYTDHYTNRAVVLIIWFDDRLAAEAEN